MRVVDTVISREGDNSVWANVVFVGVAGETVSVRLPCPSPYGGQVGRSRIVARAMTLLHDLVAAEPQAGFSQGQPATRFGKATEETRPGRERWRDRSSGKE